jgi:NADH dehydrogenase
VTESSASHVVVVGGGFGGLQAVKKLARAGARVTLLDRHNYHLFQPLTYQVATGGLAPGDIAVPLRHVLGGYSQVSVLMGEVTGFDLESREVVFDPPVGGRGARLAYDGLIVAAGSNYSYFGHEDWRSVALEVKSLDSAVEVRGRILAAFEAAESHPQDAADWLTFVVVGAGPTGVEIAGQIAELAHATLAGEFRHIDPASARVLLVEIADHVLGTFSAPLPTRAVEALEQLGVTPMLRHTVVDVRPDGVELRGRAPGPDGRVGETTQVPAHTVVWAAGVTASPLAASLGQAAGVEVDRSGRVTVQPDLSLRGHPEVMVIGDMVTVTDAKTGQPRTLPGLAPVAMQQGRYAGTTLARRLAGREPARPFHYHDKGSMATIGRARAVVQMGPIRFWGFLAWATWLVVHIFYLIGFENRIVVMLRWGYGYFTRRRGNRLITGEIRAGASSGHGEEG